MYNLQCTDGSIFDLNALPTEDYMVGVKHLCACRDRIVLLEYQMSQARMQASYLHYLLSLNQAVSVSVPESASPYVQYADPKFDPASINNLPPEAQYTPEVGFDAFQGHVSSSFHAALRNYVVTIRPGVPQVLYKHSFFKFDLDVGYYFDEVVKFMEMACADLVQSPAKNRPNTRKRVYTLKEQECAAFVKSNKPMSVTVKIANPYSTYLQECELTELTITTKKTSTVVSCEAKIMLID